MLTVLPVISPYSALAFSHQPLSASRVPPPTPAPPPAAALPDAAPLAAALPSAALVAADVELLLVVVELPPHAVSTSATALMPAMAAVTFFVGLYAIRPTSLSGQEVCEDTHTRMRIKPV